MHNGNRFNNDNTTTKNNNTNIIFVQTLLFYVWFDGSNQRSPQAAKLLEVETTITKLEIEDIEIRQEIREALKKVDEATEMKLKEIEKCKKWMRARYNYEECRKLMINLINFEIKIMRIKVQQHDIREKIHDVTGSVLRSPVTRAHMHMALAAPRSSTGFNTN